MVKTKGGRLMNPTDAFRKEQRKKEVQRNKMERKFQREAHGKKDKPETLRTELQDILEQEEAGPLPKHLRLRKKVLQDAYDQALKKKREEELKKKQGDGGVLTTPYGHGAPQIRPEESKYYHPTLNPQGLAPSHKGALPGAATLPVIGKGTIPVPKPPPLPPGPAPGRGALPPPPAAPPLPAGPAPSQATEGGAAQASAAPLPPPPGPPPGMVLPPPSFPPPSLEPPQPRPPGEESDDDDVDGPPGVGPSSTAPPPTSQPVLPPPSGPPPGILPPPPMPPPGMMLPPPPGPPPMYATPLPLAPPPGPPPGFPPAAKKDSTISGAAQITAAATVMRRPLAHTDRSVISMVPASVRVKREEAKPIRSKAPPPREVSADFGFGLVPQARTVVPPKPLTTTSSTFGGAGAATASSAGKAKAAAPASVDAKYLAFLEDMKELGAFAG